MTIQLRECALISKSGTVRLEPSSVEFPVGEITAVIGPNGAGKSTLLALASGMLKPSSGGAFVDGLPIQEMKARELARLRAVLTQDQGVTFGFTVEQVTSWGRTPWSGSERSVEAASIVSEALEAVQMSGKKDRPINELSGGERKRVHLARIIAQQAPIVLLDEPDSDLDLTGLQSLDGVIRELHTRGTTIVLTSHDLPRISGLASQAVVVANQSILAVGAVREVVTSEILSEAYQVRVRVEWHEHSAHISVNGIKP